MSSEHWYNMNRKINKYILYFAILTMILFALPGRAQGQREGCDNAATDYWKATAMIGGPQTIEELEISQFINTVLVELPPRFFSLRPDIAQGLLDERPVVATLADGAIKPYCNFCVHDGNSPFLNLDHLTYMTALTGRGLAIARAYEYAENLEGVAGIYYSLLKLTQNLDQDNNLSSGLKAAQLLQLILQNIEGFLSRDPSIESLEILTDFFESVEQPVFHISTYLHAEGSRFGRWLLEDPMHVDRKLSMLYGRSARKPAIDKLVTLTPDRKERRLQDWVMNYETRMIRLAEATEEPYRKAVTILSKLDKIKNEMKANEDAPGVNPLIPLLVPSMEKVYQRFELAEAQFGMARIITLAALYRARNNRWPVKLAEIRPLARKPLPEDPFSEKPFYYKLVSLRPRMITRLPRWMAKDNDLLYSLNLAKRRRNDAQRYQEALQIYQQRMDDQPTMERPQGVPAN